MKHTSLNTPAVSTTWHPMALAILLAVLSAAAVVVAVTTTGCNQAPIPINPTKDAPCGNGAYQMCPDHGCCLAYDEVCGQAGHACGAGECCFVGQGPMFGASRDGGTHPRSRPELTPEEAIRSGR
jgi:hypothetical protein